MKSLNEDSFLFAIFTYPVMRITEKEEEVMDEMKLKLKTKFMRGIVAKIISRAIFKSLGVKPNIQINEIEAEMKDGKIRFHINADGEISDKVLLKVNQVMDDEESL